MRRGKKTPGFTFKNTKGVEYEVLFHKPNKKVYNGAVGLCHDPNEENPKILIDPYQTDQGELNTAIHEFAHAFFWDKLELAKKSQELNKLAKVTYELLKE